MSAIPPFPPQGIPAHTPLLSLEEAAAMFPANTHNGHVSTATILRWIVGGKKKVKLKATRKSGEWFTTAEDVRRFRDLVGLAVSILGLADMLDEMAVIATGL